MERGAERAFTAKRSLAKVSMYKLNKHILGTQGKERMQRLKGRMTEGEPGW